VSLSKERLIIMTAVNDYLMELSQKAPDEICRKALCSYNSEDESYILSIWGDDYSVYPREGKIIRNREEWPDVDEFHAIFISYYLLNVKETELKNEWISERDIIGGPIFFRGMHKIPTHLIANRYGSDSNQFKHICQHLHGIPLSMADISFSFLIAPRIPVAIHFWEKDDEFPAECKMLFDRSISEHLALDIIYGLSVVVCERILGHPKK
jgi:hypothetical protein